MSSPMLINRASPALPKGVEVAWYKSYEDASKAVEHLSANDFPIDKVTIVGSGLHTVEKVIGKLTPGRVALTGATQGLTWGLLMGLMSFVIMPNVGSLIPLAAVAVGVFAGMVLATATWGFSAKKRLFASRNHVVATRYAVLVTESQDTAFELLKDSKGNEMQVRRKAARLVRDEDRLGGPPTEYGSRADEQPRFGVRLDDAQKREERPSSEAEQAPSSDPYASPKKD